MVAVMVNRNCIDGDCAGQEELEYRDKHDVDGNGASYSLLFVNRTMPLPNSRVKTSRYVVALSLATRTQCIPIPPRYMDKASPTRTNQCGWILPEK
jgi:hypothetical protein